MKTPPPHPIQNTIRLGVALALAFSIPRLHATEISGKVSAATGNAATIVIDGPAVPAVGDKVDIFFKVVGMDEEISVATGKVTAVKDQIVQVALENSTGTVAKDQMARITSAASLAGTRAPLPPATNESILGEWVGVAPDGSKVSFGFREAGILLWVVEEKGKAMAVDASYRIDLSAQPHRIEIFDIKASELKGETLRGVFEIQSDGRLKLDASGPEFTPREAVLFSRAATPIVRPSPAVAAPPGKEEQP